MTFDVVFAFEIESTQDGKEGAIDLQVQKTSDPFEIRELMTWNLRITQFGFEKGNHLPIFSFLGFYRSFWPWHAHS